MEPRLDDSVEMENAIEALEDYFGESALKVVATIALFLARKQDENIKEWNSKIAPLMKEIEISIENEDEEQARLCSLKIKEESLKHFLSTVRYSIQNTPEEYNKIFYKRLEKYIQRQIAECSMELMEENKNED